MKKDYEIELTILSNQIQKEVINAKTIEEKEELIFRFLSIINKDQYDFYYNMYKSFVDNEKEKFIRDVETNGFYLIIPSDMCYDTIKEVYNSFFIKPYPDIFDTKRRLIKDGVVGEKYIMVLKHNSNKNFSARSTFRVNRANLPSKDTSKEEE